MNKLSDRIQVIIDTMMERVSSMEESAQKCVEYTHLISEFFVMVNTVRRMELQNSNDTDFFLHIEKIVCVAEEELKKNKDCA